MENNSLKLITLLHDLTQLNYRIYFHDDFPGMITVGLEEEFFDSGVGRHYHCGYPDGPKERLESDVIEALSNFLEEVKEKENAKK